jgi:hypothetical protein
MKGDGKGGFTSKTILETGLYLPGNGKALVKLRDDKGGYMIAASQNRGPLKLYKAKFSNAAFALMPNDISAIITYKNGKTRKEEFYYGQSFLSQSGRFMLLNDKIISVTVIDNKGNKRIK